MSALNHTIIEEESDSFDDNVILPQREALPAAKKLTGDKINALSSRLQLRVNREELVDKFIIRDAVEDGLSHRQAKLTNLLANRAPKTRLCELNIIKENSVNMSDKLTSIGASLAKKKTADNLSNFLAKRPDFDTLKERRILVEDHEVKNTVDKRADAKAVLGNFFANRPSAGALVQQNILSDESLHPMILQKEKSTLSQKTPRHVVTLSDKGVVAVDVACGWGQTSVASKAGELLSFGVAVGTQTSHVEPTGIALPGPVTHLSSGDNHSSAIVGGQLYTWGQGSWGRLGLGHQHDVSVPTLVAALGGQKVIDASAGGYHTLVLLENGSVYATGWNKKGAIGVGQGFVQQIEEKSERTTILTPVHIASLDEAKIISVAAGETFSAALSADGTVYTWGSGSWGALGHGDEKDEWLPKAVAALKGEHIVKLACGSSHMLALSKSGKVFSWGRHATLGREATVAQSCTPGEVQNLPAAVTELAAGKAHSALIAGGQLYTFGKSADALGLGDASQAAVPTLVALPQPAIKLACGWSHTAVVCADGSVYTFGSNHQSALGY